MKRYITILLLALMTICMLGGCADSGKTASDKKSQTEESDDEDDDKESDKKEKSSSKKKDKKKKKKKEAGEKPEDPDNDVIDEEFPLYQRICGTYCYEYKGREDGTETYPLEIFNFGENLYAFGGDSMDSFDSDHIESYSFWAMELIPENSEILDSLYDDECDFGVLTFSVMSNLGKYWNEPDMITIKITGEGLEITGMPYIEESPALFRRNDRIERAFCYMNTEPVDERMDKDLKGIWRQKDSDEPLYIEFSENNNIKVYKKSPLSEVYYYGGSFSESMPCHLNCTVSALGYGGMPSEFVIDYSVEDKEMTVQLDELYDIIGDSATDGDELSFERVYSYDIPVITLDDIKDLEITNIYEDMEE